MTTVHFLIKWSNDSSQTLEFSFLFFHLRLRQRISDWYWLLSNGSLLDYNKGHLYTVSNKVVTPLGWQSCWTERNNGWTQLYFKQAAFKTTDYTSMMPGWLSSAYMIHLQAVIFFFFFDFTYSPNFPAEEWCTMICLYSIKIFKCHIILIAMIYSN